MKVSSRLVGQIAMMMASQLMLILGARWLIRQMDPGRERKDEAAQVGKKVLSRLNARDVTLSEYENIVAVDVVDPSDITTSWNSVGGLDHIAEVLRESIVLPFTRPDIFRSDSQLLQAPKGILMFGPPGCGKTMLAKALAKECGCCFINLQPSTFMDKWYGESQKLVEALFTLARKLQPSLIFIDEIDSFLRERQSSDSEAGAQIKAQFMTLWDGFASDGHQIVVVGATNRPEDVDRAILRRLPRTCHIPLPDEQQREEILRVMLSKEELSDDVNLATVAEFCDGYSGSDLQELCRNALMCAVRDFMKQEKTVESENSKLRPLKMTDFSSARHAVERPASKQTQNSLDELE